MSYVDEGMNMQEMVFTNGDSRALLNCFMKSMDLKISTAQASEFTHPWDLHICDQLACFYVMVSGSCTLRLDGDAHAFRLNSGDMAVLLHNKGHCLSSAQETRNVLSFSRTHTEFAHCDKISASTLIRGTFGCNANEIVSLLPEVPPVILATDNSNEMLPWITGTAKMIANESVSGQPGAQAVINDLVNLIFSQGMRTHMAGSPEQERIIEYFRHPQIGLALYQMQTQFEKPWTLASLARVCGMSRSAFAYEFKNEVGIPPMAYLLDLRLRMACRLLRNPGMKVRDICVRVGYRSQPSFTHAFVNKTGMTPGAYRKACMNIGNTV